MRTFLRNWALASAGFLALELATRPPAAGGIGAGFGGMGRLRMPEPPEPVELVLVRTPEVLVPPRSICLCAHCRACRAGEFTKGA